MKRKIIFFLLVLSALTVLAGCAGISYDMTARDRAQRYIKEKYGFSAEITNVYLAENSWLEFNWEAPAFAKVGMKHDGKEFEVLVTIRENDPSASCDNYEADIISADIGSYVKSRLRYDDIAFRIDYGNGYGRCMLPIDIRSAEDLKKSDKDKIISVYTHGLDNESVDSIDTSAYGKNTRFGIVEWRESELPEVPYGMVNGLPAHCGWAVSAIHFTNSDGMWEHTGYDRITIDNVCLVMPAECGATMEKTDGPGEPDDVPVTDWYQIHVAGKGSGAVYAAVGAKPDDEYCIEYVYNGKAYYERIPHTDAENAEYELYSHRQSTDREYEYIFRIVKRDFYKDMET